MSAMDPERLAELREGLGWNRGKVDVPAHLVAELLADRDYWRARAERAEKQARLTHAEYLQATPEERAMMEAGTAEPLDVLREMHQRTVTDIHARAVAAEAQRDTSAFDDAQEMARFHHALQTSAAECEELRHRAERAEADRETAISFAGECRADQERADRVRDEEGKRGARALMTAVVEVHERQREICETRALELGLSPESVAELRGWACYPAPDPIDTPGVHHGDAADEDDLDIDREMMERMGVLPECVDDKRADLASTLMGQARKRIAWQVASNAGEPRPSTAPALSYSAALHIRRLARALGVWPEESS